MAEKKYIALVNDEGQCFGMTDNLTDMLLWSERVHQGCCDELFLRWFNEDDIENFEEAYAHYNIANLEKELANRRTA